MTRYFVTKLPDVAALFRHADHLIAAGDKLHGPAELFMEICQGFVAGLQASFDPKSPHPKLTDRQRRNERGRQLRRPLLFLIGMKLGLLGGRILDHLIEPINRQSVRDRGRHSPILLDLLIEFDAFFTHDSHRIYAS
jgi:hypothetical protein